MMLLPFLIPSSVPQPSQHEPTKQPDGSHLVEVAQTAKEPWRKLHGTLRPSTLESFGSRNFAQLVVFDLVSLIKDGCVKLEEVKTVLQALCWVCDQSV